MRQPTIEISGPEADAIGMELAAWWKTEIGDELRPAAPSQAVLGEDQRGADPIAVAALILAVPSAIVATADLAKRIELTKKVGQFIAWVRGKRLQHSKLRIAVVDLQGRAIDVATATPPDVLEALALRKTPSGDGAPKAS